MWIVLGVLLDPPLPGLNHHQPLVELKHLGINPVATVGIVCPKLG